MVQKEAKSLDFSDFKHMYFHSANSNKPLHPTLTDAEVLELMDPSWTAQQWLFFVQSKTGVVKMLCLQRQPIALMAYRLKRRTLLIERLVDYDGPANTLDFLLCHLKSRLSDKKFRMIEWSISERDTNTHLWLHHQHGFDAVAVKDDQYIFKYYLEVPKQDDTHASN